MDKWLVNMAAGATLAALLVIFGANTFFDIVYPKGGGAEPEPEVAAVDHGGTGGETPTAEPAETPFPQLLAAASVDAGLKESRKCAACHTFDDGGPNKVGPNLHDVVSRPVAGHEGFAYSTALTEFGGEWTYEKLDCYLEDPKGCVPGNKMSFAGIKDDSARADLIAYLKSISPNAPALPEPAQAASADPAPEAAGDAAQNAGNAGNAETGTASDQEAPEETAPASAVPN